MFLICFLYPALLTVTSPGHVWGRFCARHVWAVREAGYAQSKRKELAKRNRTEYRMTLMEMMDRQSQLEKEVAALYPIPSRIKKESRVDE